MYLQCYCQRRPFRAAALVLGSEKRTKLCSDWLAVLLACHVRDNLGSHYSKSELDASDCFILRCESRL